MVCNMVGVIFGLCIAVYVGVVLFFVWCASCCLCWGRKKKHLSQTSHLTCITNFIMLSHHHPHNQKNKQKFFQKTHFSLFSLSSLSSFSSLSKSKRDKKDSKSFACGVWTCHMKSPAFFGGGLGYFAVAVFP